MLVPQTCIGIVHNLVWNIKERLPEKVEVDLRKMIGISQQAEEQWVEWVFQTFHFIS